MRIGIVPAVNRAGGGIYQYSSCVLEALCEQQLKEDEFIAFASATENLVLPTGRIWSVERLMETQAPPVSKAILDKMRKVVGEGRHRQAWRWFRRRVERARQCTYDVDRVRSRPEMTRWFRQHEIDLMLYPWPNSLSFESGIPYVMAIHDLQHRLQPEFPEVSANGEWESREYVFRNGARYATLLLADSDVGKEDILNFYGSYGVTADRVKVLPYLPATYLATNISQDALQRVRNTYCLPERYYFYPAQFWPHKNHLRIVKALDILKRAYGMKAPIVFCGSHAGEIRQRTFKEVQILSSKLGIERQVRCLGYVPDEDMSALYAGATALVMPTFFGPTNIPVLEAWAFGCPVLTSDIRGIREQAGNAAILVDPRSAESIAGGIYQLWMNEELRQNLGQRGRARLAEYTPADFRRRLIEIIEHAKVRIHTERRKTA